MHDLIEAAMGSPAIYIICSHVSGLKLLLVHLLLDGKIRNLKTWQELPEVKLATDGVSQSHRHGSSPSVSIVRRARRLPLLDSYRVQTISHLTNHGHPAQMATMIAWKEVYSASPSRGQLNEVRHDDSEAGTDVQSARHGPSSLRSRPASQESGARSFLSPTLIAA